MTKDELQTENNRLRNRDCNASVELCYDDGNNPFAREDLKVVDVGVADNCYVVESKTVSSLQAENKRLQHKIDKIYDAARYQSSYLALQICEIVQSKSPDGQKG